MKGARMDKGSGDLWVALVECGRLNRLHEAIYAVPIGAWIMSEI
jgi:hypothetical protein